MVTFCVTVSAYYRSIMDVINFVWSFLTLQYTTRQIKDDFHTLHFSAHTEKHPLQNKQPILPDTSKPIFVIEITKIHEGCFEIMKVTSCYTVSANKNSIFHIAAQILKNPAWLR